MSFGLILGLSIPGAFFAGVTVVAMAYVAFRCLKCFSCKKKKPKKNSNRRFHIKNTSENEINSIIGKPKVDIPELSPQQPISLTPRASFSYDHSAPRSYYNKEEVAQKLFL